MDTINEDIFNKKFYTVIDEFVKWMPEKFDYHNSNILDFGCEFGVMTLAIALRLKPKKVIGVDINSHHKQLFELIGDKIDIDEPPKNLEFHQVSPVEKFSLKYQFDVIFSWSAFEHVNQPDLQEVVSELYDCLSPKGFIFLQIAPLFYSAYGSHLNTLIDKPWAHLSMQNNLLRNHVITEPKKDFYKNESDNSYIEIKNSIFGCYETLNKITADGIIDLFENNGFSTIKQKRTNCSQKPPRSLLKIFSKKILKTEQIVVLFQKK